MRQKESSESVEVSLLVYFENYNITITYASLEYTVKVSMLLQWLFKVRTYRRIGLQK